MKKILIVFLLLISFGAYSATYYISTTGSNSNDGSVGSPWLTLKYACDHATTSGDVIHVNSGTYNETQQSILRVGVSIVGEGITSIITSTVTTTTGTIYGQSSMGTNGNQSISYIKMDGNNTTAFGGIVFVGRSNVSVHHCTFINFNWGAIAFYGRGDTGDGDPATPATGNTCYNNTITNCSYYTTVGSGAVRVGGQTGVLIHDNTIIQPDRGTNLNGYGIKYAAGGYNRGMKIYNNTITIPHWTAGSWNFSIESWNNRGGIEIYNNTLQGGIDVGGTNEVDDGTYGFTTKIYNNTIGFPEFPTYNERAVTVECAISDLWIYNNTFNNMTTSIIFNQSNPSDNISNIHIHNNVINGAGVNGSNGAGIGVYFTSNIDLNNIQIWNNTFYDGGLSYSSLAAVMFKDFTGTISNVSIRNNIIQGFNNSPIYFQDVAPDIVSIENNVFYGNGNSNVPRFYLITPTNKTEQNNIVSNPLFVSLGSNFNIQTGSPAKNAGLDVGITSDILGNSIQGVPDIGAYEFQAFVDTEKPIITSFSIPTTSTSKTITLSSFSVTDNVLVTGYLLSESSSTPAIDAAGWSATKQTTYRFSTVGSKTLYAWAKDAAGNISLSANDNITITTPPNNSHVFGVGTHQWKF